MQGRGSQARRVEKSEGTMKRSDTGDFCVLYIEPDDEKEAIFRVVMEQKKPIVIMLTGRGQRSEVTGDGAPARKQ